VAANILATGCLITLPIGLLDLRDIRAINSPSNPNPFKEYLQLRLTSLVDQLVRLIIDCAQSVLPFKVITFAGFFPF